MKTYHPDGPNVTRRPVIPCYLGSRILILRKDVYIIPLLYVSMSVINK